MDDVDVDFDVDAAIEAARQAAQNMESTTFCGGTPEQLKAAYAAYSRPVELKAGDLITWKPGIKNRKGPDYQYPAIVIAVLDTPVFGVEDREGSPTFREPLNLKIGMISSRDEEFLIYHVDGHRFERWSPLEAQ